MNQPAKNAPLAFADLRLLREQLLSTPASQRVGRLIEQPKVRQVLKKLPPQDLLIAIHAAGISDSLELIELLPSTQVQAIIDLETWQRDRIAPRRLASWLSVLFAANPQAAMHQVLGLDPELLSLFLKLHTRVYDLGQEEDPDVDGYDFIRTPDQRYLVAFIPPPNFDDPEDPERPDPSDVIGTEVARKIINGMIAREPFTASRYLESVRWELPSELEETSLRWRSGRLGDLGYPDMYEALAIYAPLDPMHPPLSPAANIIPDPEDPDNALTLFVDEYSGAPLLRAALNALDSAEADRIRRQMTALANRVAAAQALSPGDLEGLAQVVHESTATVNLGLEFQSRGDLDKACEILHQEALVILFRTGHSLSKKIAREARTVADRLRVDDDYSLMPSMAEEVYAALNQRAPKIFSGLVQPGAIGRQPFETLQQLARAAEFVADGAFVAALLIDVMGFDPRDADVLISGEVNLDDAQELDVDRILATGLCRASIGGALDPSPLTRVELSALRDAVRQGADKFIEASVERLTEFCVPHLPLPGAQSQKQVGQRAKRWCLRMSQTIEEEFAAVQGDIDPRFVSAVLCAIDAQ